MILEALGVRTAAIDILATARTAEAMTSRRLRSAADRTAARAAASAPRDTGDLAGSIRAHGLSVIATADHARFVHDGTIRTPPRPFIADALHVESDATASHIMDDVAGRLGF